MMMRGMTAKDFDPERYSGRWFEVASLKRGFAGQGQEDCHCTQVNAKINIAVNIQEEIWFRKELIIFGFFFQHLSLMNFMLFINHNKLLNLEADKILRFFIIY